MSGGQQYPSTHAGNPRVPLADRISVSVVVPTRDRPEALRRCLNALTRQEGVAFEVIVVDDGSAAEAAVRQVVGESQAARLVLGAGGGPGAARNLGARAARAEVVCFTDDDCEPSPRWAELLARVVTRGATVAAGATVNARPENPFSAASQAITNYFADHGDPGFAASNNLACRADLIDAFPFDDRYPDAAGEDRDWCARVAAAGERLVVEPAALVFHRQELGLGGFVRQQRRYGRGAWRFRRSGSPARGTPRTSLYVGLLQTGFRAGPTAGALFLLSQVMVGVGFLEAALTERWLGRETRQVRSPEPPSPA